MDARAVSGPLLAVCGLGDGAGAATLTYLVAHAAAAGGHPVLAVCAQRATRYSLAGLAEAVAHGEPLDGGVYVQEPSGVRLMTRGDDSERASEAGLRRVLDDAREAHALTVVDCGTLARPLDRAVLDAATHVAWILPASLSGLARARATLGTLPPARLGREAVIAQADRAERTVARHRVDRPRVADAAPLADLAALADDRGGPLVLLPHVDSSVDAAGTALTGILGFVQR